MIARTARLSAAAALVALAAAAAGPAAAQMPALAVPQDRLEAALLCPDPLTGGATPVLLVPGTGEDPEFFKWNYEAALRRLAIPYCSVTLPAHGTGDIQEAAEYVVHAVRTMRARAGRRVSMIGHSQGGMLPRWVFKYWPDTRAMVDDLIALTPSNHGTRSARSICNPDCAAAVWQQRDDSKFIAALNSGDETFAGPSYTTVYTHTDEIVTPNADEATGSSSLRTGPGARRNVAVQDLCPANTNEHLQVGSYDPVGYALAKDALANPGPADPARIPATVCAQVAHEGVNGATFAADASLAFARVLQNFGSGEPLPAEPPLACYVTATCPASASGGPRGQAPRSGRAPGLRVATNPRRIRAGRTTRVEIRVRVLRGRSLSYVRGARVRVAGRTVTTPASGRVVVRLRPERAGTITVTATRAGFRQGRTGLRGLAP